MLLGVLSQYSWLDFITFIVIVDGIVLALGFALDRFVWSKDKGLTKNDQRTIRESDEIIDRDYRKLNESVTDYNDVKSIDDSFDNDGEEYGTTYSEEEYQGHTSDIADKLDDDEDSGDEGYVPDEMVDDDMESDDVEENNDKAQTYFHEREDCEVLTDDDYDGAVNNGMETIEDEEDKRILASEENEEELYDVSISQGDGMDGFEVFESFGDATPIEIGEIFPSDDDMDDPEDKEPKFDEE